MKLRPSRLDRIRNVSMRTCFFVAGPHMLSYTASQILTKHSLTPRL